MAGLLRQRSGDRFRYLRVAHRRLPQGARGCKDAICRSRPAAVGGWPVPPRSADASRPTNGSDSSDAELVRGVEADRPGEITVGPRHRPKKTSGVILLDVALEGSIKGAPGCEQDKRDEEMGRAHPQ